ncbi:MAG: alpha/beta fold hydrolase, partial [Stackebrandtia sp.]
MLTATASDGVTVRAHDEGRGPVILVLHPGMDDGSSWKRVAARLADRFRMLRLQRRQYRFDLPAGSTMAEEALDVRALVDAVGEPMLVVGHSS